MKYAIFVGALTPNQSNIVAEVVEAPRVIDGHTFQLSEMYSAALVATMRQCPDDTVANATYDVVSDTWANPDPEVAAMGADEDGGGETDTGNGNPPPN